MSTSRNMFARVKPRKNLTVFLVCVVMATLFWLLNALSKPYVVAISVPLKYTGLSEEHILVNSPTRLVQVRVEGEGYSLLGMGDEQHSPADIDLSGMFRLGEMQKQFATVTTKLLQRQIQDEVGSAIRILGISHDSIQLEVEPVISKTVILKPQVKVNTASGYVVTRTSVSPNKVEVKGPKSILDTITACRWFESIEEEVSASFSRVVQPKMPKLLSITPNELELNVEVEQITEGIYSVPVRALHVPDTLNVNLYPPKIEVTFTAPISHFDSIQVEDFRAVVDFKTANADGVKKLRVRVIAPKGDVKLIDYRPKRLEYIIRRL